MRSFALALCLLVLSQSSHAATLHVPVDYGTIGAAIAAANPGDEVLVAAGRYYEQVALDASKDGVKIHSEAGPAATIIDGLYMGSVVTMSSVGTSTELIGFTIAHGGHYTPTPSDLGGAIRLNSSSPLIEDCIIEFGLSYYGSLYLSSGSPTITACTFDLNSAQLGGGIYVQAGSPKITGNTITNNTGGGIACGGSAATIKDNVISGNQAWRGGGVIVGSGATVTGNQFLSNVATSDGGAVATSGDPTVSNNEFRGNSASGSGGAISVGGSSTIEGNVFVGNSAASGGAIVSSGRDINPSITDNILVDNEATVSLGGAIFVENYGQATIERNVMARNRAAGPGGGIAVAVYSKASVKSNTLALNQASAGAGLYVEQGSQLIAWSNIISNSVSGGGVSVGASSAISYKCNDVWGNAGGDYSGIADPTGTGNNISSDPLFCSLASLDVHLTGPSPCAKSYSLYCGQIGAFDVGCTGPVRAQPTTWGRVKATYR